MPEKSVVTVASYHEIMLDMLISDLTPNPKNPRTITDEKLKMLKNSLEEFGDLSGIVFNRTTNQIVGGHQRVKIFDAKSKIVITKVYEKPSKTGTYTVGYLLSKGGAIPTTALQNKTAVSQRKGKNATR